MKKTIFIILFLFLILFGIFFKYIFGFYIIHINPCYGTCSIPDETLEFIKNLDSEFYTWTQQTKSPECRMHSPEQIQKIKKSREQGIFSLSNQCDGEYTYCDCKMKDGKYLSQEMKKRMVYRS
jgi:hypothetical protein